MKKPLILFRENAILILPALLKLGLNVAFHGNYGYFRDELYYLACSDHLAWGYVDQPPLSIFVLAATRWLSGDSLHAIRFSAALAGAGVVFLAGLTARKLGGGRFAQFLSALAAALSPVILGNGARYFSMNAFDLLFWALAMYLIVLIIKDDRPPLWPLFGAVAGLGLLNKYSVLFLGFGLLAGLLLTVQRKHLLNKWFWLGGLIAAVVVLPHFLWELEHAFPSLEFMRRASAEKNVDLTLGGFLFGQFLNVGFIQYLICLVGIGYFFLHREGKRFRPLAWMYVVVFGTMVLTNAKAYYLSPVYTVFFAAGAVALEKALGSRKLNWWKPAAAVLLILFSLIALPFAVPVLPVETLIGYSRFLGFGPVPEERHELGELDQPYADMFGWEEFVEKVAQVYGRLSPPEQAQCVIYVRNYGQAGAIDFFGQKHGLPPAVCGHNNYWYWGPGDREMEVAIIVGDVAGVEENLADLRSASRFEEAELAATTQCRYCMPYENNRQIFLCRKPRFSLKEIWPEERNFN